MIFCEELYYGWVNVSFGCRVDTRVIAFPASPPPPARCLAPSLSGLLLAMSSQIPRTIFGKSLLSLKKLIAKLHRQEEKWVLLKLTISKKFACHCWHVLSLVNQTAQFTNCPDRNKLIRLRQKICQSSSSQKTEHMLLAFILSQAKWWKIHEASVNSELCFFSKQFSDSRQGSDCSGSGEWRRPLLLLQPQN